MGLKVVPALVVFHTPPAAAATYQMRASWGSTAKSMIRPETSAGPMPRNSRPEKTFSSYLGSFDSGAAGLAAVFGVSPAGAAWRERGRESRRARAIGSVFMRGVSYKERAFPGGGRAVF